MPGGAADGLAVRVAPDREKPRCRAVLEVEGSRRAAGARVGVPCGADPATTRVVASMQARRSGVHA